MARGTRHIEARRQSQYDWKSWAVCVLATIFIISLSEIGLRAIAFATNKVRGATFDSELGWRLIPNITKKDKQWCNQLPATTNSSGWRDGEHELEKSAGTTRIVALGDSFTFGYGVDYGQRFSEFLEQDLPQLDVVNMGVFAYGTDQELRTYELHGRQYKPDVVLLNVTLQNDLVDLRHKEVHSFPKPYFILSEGDLTLFKPEQDWALFFRSHSYLIELAFRAFQKPSPIYGRVIQDADSVALFLAIVRRLSEEVRKDNAKLLLVLIHPRKASQQRHLVNVRISKTLSKLGYHVLDLYEVYQKQSERGADLYLPDRYSHWNANGNRLAANEIRDYLVANKWVNP